MGRSKFPGKPPKTATRKRIKVLGQPEATQSDPVTVAENIYYGLSLFNETFGDNEKEHPPFHGFSTKEANLSASYIKTQQHNAEKSNDKLPSVTVENLAPQSKDATDATNSTPDIENSTEKLADTNSKPVEDITNPVANSDAEHTPKIHRSKSRKNCKKLQFANYLKTPVLKSVNNILDQHQRTRQLRNSTAKRLLQRAKSSGSNARGNLLVQSGEKPSTVRKFVLPVRSVHSSRVIKPNKRFIEELEEITGGTEHSENDVGTHGKKAKLNVDKFGNQESKLKGDTVSKLCTRLKDKIRNKSRKAIQSVDSNVEIIQQARNTDKSGNSVQNAQISKPTHREVKKSHTISCKNKVSNSASINSNSNSQECPQNSSRVAQTAKSTVPRNQKQISIPTKVLPDSNVPNFESSRVQTRSGTQNEVASDLNNQASGVESGAGSTEDGCAKTAEGQPENNSNKTVVSALDNYETESNLSESETESEHSNHSESEQSEFSGMKLNGGKVILRKARLKLDNKCLAGTEGPFSTTSTSNTMGGSTNLGLTGTVKCGVCGAVRFYRFVKQARKFGVYSCESCRKFISKMIKRQACAKSSNNVLPILPCHKGDGLCLVPPVVRSQQWNLMRCVYKARCPACWLKMCLKCYNIPPALRTGLNALLPPLMRDPLSISLPLSQDEDGQGQKLNTPLGWPAEDSTERNLFKSAMSWRDLEMGQKTSYQGTGGFLYTKIDKLDSSTQSISPNKKRKKNRLKVRKKIRSPTLTSPIDNQCPQPLRQRLELKGPRVKHVCRSASVALGQPIATFPAADTKEDNEHGKNIPKITKESEKAEKRDEATKEKETLKCSEENNLSLNTTQQTHPRRGKQQNVSTAHFSAMSKAATDTLYTVSIDFWEQYEPSEIGTKGFALIGSELFHIPATCYLCGSAGKEPLIHCQCCCEPYHAFCLEPSEWNACAQPNWCCPRCTICQSCHLRSGPKLSCIRCRQSFHHSCLSKSGVSSRLYSPDRPYVCQSCIKCKSCGSEGVSVYVGNLPLCSMCFKLRQQGNYCPLCQRCYNENDFDTKMMECSECSCWVHARCEGLSDERYQILSYLPDSIEYTCSQCSSNSNSVWRNAIEAELKAGFISVIKSLSKNRKICTALKWSPRKECLCRPIPNARKLEFFEDKIETTYAKENEESEENNGDRFVDVDSSVGVNYRDGTSKSDLEEHTTDNPIRKGLRRLRQKFQLKECSVRVKNCIPKDSFQGFEKKDWTNEESVSSDVTECHCSEQQVIARPSPTLMSVKRKVNGNEYKSLSQFHCDMEYVINRAGSKDLMNTYHEILQEVFPWFIPKNFKNIDDNDDMLTPSKDVCKDTSLKTKFDDPVLEAWKEEVMRAPKAIAAKTANLYNIHVEDSRSCCLCKGLGDGQEMKEGRLLYCGQNEWVHANCALWSNEVFEEIDGSLQNVHSAISRGRLIRCTECGKKGASIGCCAKNCSNTFHFPCARSVGLTFNDDKRIFCASHSNSYAHKPLQNENEFSLKRSVYVELDRKKKKYVEPNKVKVMIGSLMIDCLGTVVPEFSDTAEKIVPCDYKCSRLYWSTVNPYKIVRYYIRTYIQVHKPDVSSEVENNITIDHTKEQEKEEVSRDAQRVDYLAVKQTLDTLVDIVCNKEVDENLAEQNNTDLLPPELKEAIFEDLPHDLLDGISMQDIFPKMSYEDFLAMDLKNDASFSTDLFKDDMLPSEIEEIKSPENKISKMDPSVLELGAHNDLWVRLETKTSVQDLMDDLFNSKSQKRGGRELKRSKSEVMSNNPLIVGGQRHHQRSCSLTWSCKLDNTYGPSIKRRKLPRNPSSTKPSETGLIVLDAQNERTSMFHELRIPDIMVTVGRANTSNILSDSVRELKYCIEDSAGLNRRVLPARDDAKEHKRLFWHPRQQQPRIVQVDGPADANSASECSSPEYNTEEKSNANIPTSESLSIPQLDGINDEHSSDASELSVEKDLSLYTRASNFLHPKRIFSFIRSQMTGNGNDKSQKAKNGNGNLALAPSTRCTLHKVEALLKEQSLKLNLEIPQVDGAGDISSDDECVTSQHHAVARDKIIHATYESPFEHHIDRPVTCKRCCCTYRTQDSYNRHLANCDSMITSDSDSETMDNKLASPDSRFSPSVGSVSPQFITLSPSEGHTLSTDYTDIQATSPIEASVPSPHPSIQIEPIAQAIITPQIHTAHATVETVHQTVLTSNDMIVQTQYTRRTTTLPNPAVLPPQESTVQITEITDPPSVSNDSNVTTHSMMNTPMSSPDSTSSQTVPSPEISPNYLTTSVQTAQEANTQQANAQVSRVAVVAKSKTPRVTKPKAKSVKSQQQQQQHIVKNVVQTPHTAAHVRFQPATIQGSTTPVIQLQQTAQRPTVILQQVPSPGIVSAYVETLQQQSGQNLQYITTLGSGQHETGFKPQFIATNPLMPGTYIQAPSADNLLTLQNGGISILPSVQITQTQPTVLGTIIQQQPGAIQCGVISSEQLLLSSTPTLEMFADPTGGMFVSNQPMYYGLETIVSNTVMSSSQFMAGAVPQVLASSYQTTTQVFQASKLMEPIVDVQTVSGVPTVTAVQAMQNVSGMPGVQNVPAVPNITGVSNVTSVQGVNGMPNVPAVAGGYVVVNQSTPAPPPTPAAAPTAITTPTVTPVPASIPALAAAPTPASVPTAIPAAMPTSVQVPASVSALASAQISASALASASAVAPASALTSVATSTSILAAPPPPPPPPPPLAPSLSLSSMEPIASSQINISATPQEQVFGGVTCNVSPASCTNMTKQPVTSIQVADVCPSNIHVVTSNSETMSTKLSPLPPPPHAMPSIPRVAVRPSPVMHSITNHGAAWRITEPLFGTDQPMNNNVRPYFDSKHVSENTSMIKSSISSSKIPPLSNHYVAQRNLVVNSKPNHDVNSMHKSYNGSITPSSNCANASVNSNNNNQIVVTCSGNIAQNKISMPTSNSMPTSRPMNRVLPMQAVTPKQDPAKTVPKDDLVIEEPTKPVIKPAEPEIAEPKKTVTEEIAPIKKPTDIITLSNISESMKLNTDTIEKVKENLKLELDKEKLQNTSLKIVLQKQLQDGSYKITRNMKAVTQSKKAPQVTSVEILPAKQVPQIASLQLLPIKTFTLKTNKIEDKAQPVDAKMNLLKTKTPPVAVKKPRIVAKSIRSMRNNNPTHNSQQIQKNCAKGPTLMYEIKSQDGFTHTATSMAEVWETVFQAVQDARKAHNLPPLPHNSLSESLGLENNATIYLIEQLPGVNRCTKYKTRFHTPAPPKPDEMENELPAACASGAARAEAFKGRKAHDMFGWLASQHRPKISEAESRRAANPNFPTAMRFRTLKGASKGSLGVYHSHIHGRGLFCLRDIEAGEMVIEYAGEVIRSSLTDKREKYYDSKNIGCYMFKIDDHLVVDATMKGNAARFINHSCEPNCYSRVVDIVGKKQILIFALRRIIQGEELTYDYKFPFEDIKIPCTCGSRRCRKYLN